MDAAFGVFESLEAPTGAEEDWRYVNRDMSLTGLAPILEPGAPLPAGPFLASVEATSGAVLIVDGAVLEASSAEAAVTRLGESDGEVAFSSTPADHNKLAAAHTAFAGDAALVDVAAGQVMESPLVVEVQGVTPGTVSFPHIAVSVGEGAEAQILVVYRSAEGAPLLMVPEVSLRVAAGARLRCLSVQGLDPRGAVVTHQRMKLGRDATGRLGEVGLGGELGRLDLGVSLEGDGSSSEVVGLYFGEGAQTLDYRMVINHSGRGTTSDILLKGAVEDEAESVFTGLLRIEEGAAGASTFETNRNLVLSGAAKAHSVPNLEILCDDVVCGHGSSVGPLEAEQLYYLRSRGLSTQRAERLLVKGFFQEIIDRLPIRGVEAPVSEEVLSRFEHAQGRPA